MTLRTEAITLLNEVPDKKLKAVIGILKALQPEKKKKKRLPVGPGHKYIDLPEGFFDHFDDDNEEIAASFYGDFA